MKVGILGGTFDPIHNAHIEIAKAALNQFSLDRVMVMPTPNPPHKDKKTICLLYTSSCFNCWQYRHKRFKKD